MTYEVWWSLPEWERTDYEAYEVWRATQIDLIEQSLISAEKYTPETLAILNLQKYIV